MGAFGDRFQAKLALYGHEITLNGTATTRAIVQDLLSSQMSQYLDYSEQSLVTRPGLLLTLAADDGAAVGDTFTLGGRLYSILKISGRRLGGEVGGRIAVAA